jgi:hypothetical protein
MKTKNQMSVDYQRDVEILLLNVKKQIEHFLEKTKDQSKKETDKPQRRGNTEWLNMLSSDETEIFIQAIKNKDQSTIQKLFNKYNSK